MIGLHYLLDITQYFFFHVVHGSWRDCANRNPPRLRYKSHDKWDDFPSLVSCAGQMRPMIRKHFDGIVAWTLRNTKADGQKVPFCCAATPGRNAASLFLLRTPEMAFALAVNVAGIPAANRR